MVLSSAAMSVSYKKSTIITMSLSSNSLQYQSVPSADF